MTYEERQANALRNAGGNVNSPLYQSWLKTYGPGAPQYTPGNAPSAPIASDMTGILPQYYQSVSSGMRGEMPEDVLNLLAQQAAERGVSSGLAGSQAAQYAGLRNLRDVALQQIANNQKLASAFPEMAQRERFQGQEMDYRNRELSQRADLERERIAANAQMTREGFAADAARAAASRPTQQRQPTAAANVARNYLGPTPTYGSAGSPWGTGSTYEDLTGQDWTEFTGWAGGGTPQGAAQEFDYQDPGTWNVQDFADYWGSQDLPGYSEDYFSDYFEE